MIDQLMPVIVVVVLVAFVLIRQIQHVTNNIDQKGVKVFTKEKNNFEKYSKFSVEIQNHIREIKSDIDSSKNKENPTYILLDKNKEEESIELLSDFLRKLVFFETLLAKNKASSEIESDLFEVLSKLDDFIRKNIKDGEILADSLRDKLYEVYHRME